MKKNKYNLIGIRRTHKKCIDFIRACKLTTNGTINSFLKFFNTFFRLITFEPLKLIQSTLLCVRVLFFIYPSWLTIRKHLTIFPGTICSKCPGDGKEHTRRQVKRQLAGHPGCSCILTTSMRFFSPEKLKKSFRMRLPERLFKKVNLGLFRGVCNLSLFSIRLHSITEKGFLSEFLRFVLPYSNGVINGKKIC